MVTRLLLVCALGAGCSASPPAAPGAGAVDAADEVEAAPDAGYGGDAVAPPADPLGGPDPATFDCTNPATPAARRAPAPIGCVTDPLCSGRLVVGHRGAGGDYGRVAPENSLAAIRAALWMGLDGVELDVRHTKDDRLVVIHDADVDRTTVGKGAVSDMTLAEVAALGLKPANTSGYRWPGDFSCERVPSLADAFALVKGRMFVDLDTKTSRIDLVVAAIEEAGVVDQVFVSVSDASRAAAARALNPAIKVQVRPDTARELEAVLALFPDRAPEIVEVPLPKVGELAPAILAAGATVFTDVWEADVQAFLIGADPALYATTFAAGAKVIQSEFPGYAISARLPVSP